jgi:VIT1/CCC1 family predicted Fe2+/Mn2+ transporter
MTQSTEAAAHPPASHAHWPHVHRSHRQGWLRAAVLGADDGVVSTSALLLGVIASSGTHEQVLVAGIAGLVAGAASMAAGEYVSVSSQRDAEEADISVEAMALKANPRGELRELADIYEKRGLDPELAMQVALKLSEANQLESHLRDELGIDSRALARPLQAAGFSAASFASAGALPLIAYALAPAQASLLAVIASAGISLAVFGSIAARLGGAHPVRGALRVLVGGGLAMAVTALIGHLFHVALG